jgi:ribosomal protein L22
MNEENNKDKIVKEKKDLTKVEKKEKETEKLNKEDKIIEDKIVKEKKDLTKVEKKEKETEKLNKEDKIIEDKIVKEKKDLTKVEKKEKETEKLNKEDKIIEDKIVKEKKDLTKVENKEEKKENKQKKQVNNLKVKKDFAITKGISLPISTKDSVAICRFVRYKKIDMALNDLEDVLKKKKFIPMKGEIPHRKGKSKIGSGSGRYPLNSVKIFIKLLKNLKANSENNGLENQIITISSASNASRPFGKFGKVKKKRTNVKLIAREKKQFKKNNLKWKKEKQ